jgi:hypothetical protein
MASILLCPLFNGIQANTIYRKEHGTKGTGSHEMLAGTEPIR